MTITVPLATSLVPSVKLFVEHHADSLIEPKPPCIEKGFVRIYAEHDGTNPAIYPQACNWEICLTRATTEEPVVLIPEKECSYSMYCLKKDEKIQSVQVVEAKTTTAFGLFIQMITCHGEYTRNIYFTLKEYGNLQ